jgi:polynucleotide 5'-kinase involved in rRNA processing
MIRKNIDSFRYPKVAYLDCDIGQTEFTPPGFVSLSFVESPLFGKSVCSRITFAFLLLKPNIGPAFTHLIQPDASFFIGATSPKHDPDYYLACIMELWQKFKSSASVGIPLVVNTQGWIKGLYICR